MRALTAGLRSSGSPQDVLSQRTRRESGKRGGLCLCERREAPAGPPAIAIAAPLPGKLVEGAAVVALALAVRPLAPVARCRARNASGMCQLCALKKGLGADATDLFPSRSPSRSFVAKP